MKLSHKVLREKIKEIFDDINENSHPLGTKSWLHQLNGMELRVLALLGQQEAELREYIEKHRFPRCSDMIKEVLGE